MVKVTLSSDTFHEATYRRLQKHTGQRLLDLDYNEELDELTFHFADVHEPIIIRDDQRENKLDPQDEVAEYVGKFAADLARSFFSNQRGKHRGR